VAANIAVVPKIVRGNFPKIWARIGESVGEIAEAKPKKLEKKA
jgi:hypothetical protein